MVFERLLKLSVLGKITVDKFRDFGVLFESGIIMTREALHPMILCAFSLRIKQTDDFDGIFMLCKNLRLERFLIQGFKWLSVFSAPIFLLLALDIR